MRNKYSLISFISRYFPHGSQEKKSSLLNSARTRGAEILPAFILVVTQRFSVSSDGLCGKLVGTGAEAQAVSQLPVRPPRQHPAEPFCLLLFCLVSSEHPPSLSTFFTFRDLSSGFNLHRFCIPSLRQHHGKRTEVQSDEQHSPNHRRLTSLLQLR